MAYRDGVIASDTMLSYGGTCLPQTNLRKVRRIGDALYGMTGHPEDFELFEEWFQNGADKNEKPSLNDDFLLLAVNQEGRIQFWTDSLAPYDIDAGFMAIGSGKELALAAMEAGADAIRAVEIACKYDTGSELPVASVTFDDVSLEAAA